MIEGLITLIIALVEAIVAIFTAVIEFIAGLIAAGGDALTAGEAFIAIFAFIVELVFWLILWLIELVIALFTWRKPHKIRKPIIWCRKKREKAIESTSENNA